MPAPGTHELAARLRAEFDEAFARARSGESPPELDFLMIGAGGRRYAVPLPQVAALHADRRLTEAPSSRRELLGLVGLRGVVAPVFDLCALLGHAGAAAPRFVVHVRAPSPLAVAFEHLEAHLRVPAAAFVPAGAEARSASGYENGSLRTPQGPVTALDLLAVFRSLVHGAPRERTEGRGEKRS